MKKNLAIFASGNGSNAEKIWDFFNDHSELSFPVLVSSNPEAPVVQKGKIRDLKIYFFPQKGISLWDLVKFLKENSIEGLVLSGYLKKIPKELIKIFPQKIINIHPSLLPRYGGKGMYGMHVHDAVVTNKENYSGITIHLVTENYDEGPPLLQVEINIQHITNAEELSTEIRILEHAFYPPFIEAYFCREG